MALKNASLDIRFWAILNPHSKIGTATLAEYRQHLAFDAMMARVVVWDFAKMGANIAAFLICHKTQPTMQQPTVQHTTVQHISVQQLAAWLATPQNPQVVILDVREPEELAICQLTPSINIPVEQINLRYRELEQNAHIVCLCHSGRRSLYVAQYLKAQGFEHISNLTGGIEAWAREIDPAMALY